MSPKTSNSKKLDDGSGTFQDKTHSEKPVWKPAFKMASNNSHLLVFTPLGTIFPHVQLGQYKWSALEFFIFTMKIEFLKIFSRASDMQ
jgi:hypothetical protein